MNGIAVSMVAAGVLLMYAAVKDYQILDVLRWVASGGRKFPPQKRKG